jgi:ribosomal protein L16/L10AE
LAQILTLNPTHNQRKTVRDNKIKIQKTNNTNETFSDKETTLLETALKYNLQTKKKNWVVKLALEAETAITQLLILDHEYHRKVAECIDTPHAPDEPHSNYNTNSEI